MSILASRTAIGHQAAGQRVNIAYTRRFRWEEWVTRAIRVKSEARADFLPVKPIRSLERKPRSKPLQPMRACCMVLLAILFRDDVADVVQTFRAIVWLIFNWVLIDVTAL